MADVDEDDILLVSPRYFKTKFAPRLDIRIYDKLYAAICLLFLGSADGGRPVGCRHEWHAAVVRHPLP